MKTVIKIDGMHCGSCKSLIEDVASEIPGIVSCSVNVERSEAIIEHTETFEPAEFIAEVTGLGGGYKARLV